MADGPIIGMLFSQSSPPLPHALASPTMSPAMCPGAPVLACQPQPDWPAEDIESLENFRIPECGQMWWDAVDEETADDDWVLPSPCARTARAYESDQQDGGEHTNPALSDALAAVAPRPIAGLWAGRGQLAEALAEIADDGGALPQLPPPALSLPSPASEVPAVAQPAAGHATVPASETETEPTHGAGGSLLSPSAASRQHLLESPWVHCDPHRAAHAAVAESDGLATSFGITDSAAVSLQSTSPLSSII